MNISCPFCEQDTQIEKVKQQEQFDIRDETILVDRLFYRCEKCDEEFEIATDDYDPYDRAYRAYRQRKGWVQPEDIKAFRERLGLSQKVFSDILGIGIATLNRYENGALQTEANNHLITLCMTNPQNLISLLKAKPDALSKSDQEKLIANLMEDIELLNKEALMQKSPIITTGSDKALVQLPKSLWEKLSQRAESDGVNIDISIVSILSEAVGASRSPKLSVKETQDSSTYNTR